MDGELLRPVWVEVDLDALSSNIKEVKRLVSKNAEILAAVKADAYGHGAVPVSNVFLQNGADRLGVSNLSEGIELRNAGIKASILNLGYTHEQAFHELIKHDITATIYNYKQALVLSNAARDSGKRASIHLKIDTGMGRLGFQPSDDAVKTIILISKLEGINLEGIFTHFAQSDIANKSYSRKQFELFSWVIAKIEKEGVNIPIKHVSNSAAIIDLPEYTLDMVRPGIMLYGYAPSDEVQRERVELHPAMKLKARLSNIKSIPLGAGISYGLTWKASRPSIIGTIPLGYADGYRRALSNSGSIGYKGHTVKVVGRVCMDQCMVDLTEYPGASMGDEVVLFGGPGAPCVEDLARQLGTIPHEVTCAISRRVPRVYLKGGEAFEIRDYLQYYYQ